MPALDTLAPDEVVTIPSRLFGPLRVPVTRILDLPDGLRGFEGMHRFVLLASAEDGVFWLQSADEGNLAFLVVDPFIFFPEYSVALPTDGTSLPGPESPDNLIVLVIVTLPHDATRPATANLQAPLVVNMARQLGQQIVIMDSPYGAREPLRLPGTDA